MLQNPYLPSGGIGVGVGPTAAPSPNIGADITGPASKGKGFGGMVDTLTSRPANIGSLLGTVAGLALNSTPIGLGLSLAGRMIGGFGFGGPTADPNNAPENNDPIGSFADDNDPGPMGPAGGSSPSGADNGPGSPGSADPGGDGEGWYNGGYVPRNALRGENPTGPDEGHIPIQSGEFVLPRSAVKALGPQRLKMLQAMTA